MRAPDALHAAVFHHAMGTRGAHRALLFLLPERASFVSRTVTTCFAPHAAKGVVLGTREAGGGL